MAKGSFPFEVIEFLQSLNDVSIVKELWKLIMINYAHGILPPHVKSMDVFISNLTPSEEEPISDVHEEQKEEEPASTETQHVTNEFIFKIF